MCVETEVREILGLVHEEEVKAPPALLVRLSIARLAWIDRTMRVYVWHTFTRYHQFRRELKDQQDKIRILRKKWWLTEIFLCHGIAQQATPCRWDDHRDFDGLVDKVLPEPLRCSRQLCQVAGAQPDGWKSQHLRRTRQTLV